ncbi:hypothetical protein K437DRAFT_260435 [Tilletiaria anomala UBC 951]|uniref:Uncharacterized protein n=1 Tax=Tilletiaria anomala (strain ATCC 24038 / CBS 436.72 / UBC 951) TaxID=1037660 RepID=A0A066UZT6_TILAU|nr:uncharacterized protein K437DRAFT_260435 [Tilletiaria anomala UBC 951]KDN34751.1 hypothetical protein K437DRAFT_260435 [Tilletiaria anomala UBC 951]
MLKLTEPGFDSNGIASSKRFRGTSDYVAHSLPLRLLDSRNRSQPYVHHYDQKLFFPIDGAHIHRVHLGLPLMAALCLLSELALVSFLRLLWRDVLCFSYFCRKTLPPQMEYKNRPAKGYYR